MKLSVVIVNYNVKYFLEQCLNSVFESAKHCETEVFFVFIVHVGQVNRALVLDVFYHMRYCVLRGNRNQHVHMILHQMFLFDPTLPLLSQFAEHFPEVATQLLIQHTPSALRDEHYVIFALLLRVV